MSLVLDALNKANQEKKQHKDDINEANHLKELKRIQKKRFYILIFVNMVLMILLVSYFVFFNQESVKNIEKKSNKKHINDYVTKKSIVNKPQLEKMQVVKVIKSDFSENQNNDVKIKRKFFKAADGFILRLNGTYIDNNEAFVLFEDDMYQAGDIINNKVKILSVTKKTVKIQYKGNNYDIPN